MTIFRTVNSGWIKGAILSMKRMDGMQFYGQPVMEMNN